MKIFVSVPDRHTTNEEIIRLEVEPSNTIKNIKSKFLEEALIPNDRGLEYEGIQLQNNRTVSSYNIKEGSKVNYYGQVSDRLLGATYIYINRGKFVFRVPAKVSDKIGDVLAKFLNEWGNYFQIEKFEEYQLVFGGKELDNNRTLADYNITNGSLVNWVRFRGRVQFFVKTLTGKTFSLSGDVSDTIANVKAMLYAMEGIRPELMRLSFCGKDLQDSKTLIDCNVANGSTFQLILRLMGCGFPRADGKAVDYVGKVKKYNGADDTENGEENKKEDESKKDETENNEERAENNRENLDSQKEGKKGEEKDETPAHKRKADSQEDESII